MIADPAACRDLMSSIIPELGDDLSRCRQQYQKITNHKTLLPDPATRTGVRVVSSSGGKGPYVCHGSTREKEIVSTPRRYPLGKTRMLFPCGGSSVRHCDLWRDSEERANFALSPVTGSL